MDSLNKMDNNVKEFDEVVAEYNQRTEANMLKVVEIVNELVTRGRDLEKELERTKKERDELANSVAQHYTKDREIMIHKPAVDDPVLV
jgi:hypothetical protein